MQRTRGHPFRELGIALALAAVAAAIASQAAFGQGTVAFANSGTFATTADRRVYDPVTCAPLVGTNWVAALYFGPEADKIDNLAVRSSDDQTLLSAIARFRDVDSNDPPAGTWSGGNRTLLDVVIGQTLIMQVRVWDMSFFATFDDARAMGGFAMESAPFSYIVPSSLDANALKMDNFRGIAPIECVPEPTVFALVACGIGVMLVWRCKNSKGEPSNIEQ